MEAGGQAITPLSKMDLSRIKLRLQNIRKKVTDSVSYEPSETPLFFRELGSDSVLSCLEDPSKSYTLNPKDNRSLKEWPIYAYDESVRTYKALEGDLVFCSSAIIRIDERYSFNLTVLPCFLTSMRKFEHDDTEGIHFGEDINVERNKLIIQGKNDIIRDSIEPHSIVFIDGPLIGENITTYTVELDTELRESDCIPVYFVKNSESSLIVDNSDGLKNDFNSDFHWACRHLDRGSRSAFFKYAPKGRSEWSKVFSYVKVMWDFPQRVEMHELTFRKYNSLVPSLMNLIAYFDIVQGDYYNPQARPIAVAEKYAREGLKLVNIPALLSKLGFHPSMNQVRFG